MKTAIRSSAGSIQNDVVAAPPHEYSPRAAGDQRQRRIDRHREAEAEADAVVGRLPRTASATCRAGICRPAGGCWSSAAASSVRAGARRRSRRRGSARGRRSDSPRRCRSDRRRRTRTRAGFRKLERLRIVLQRLAALAVGGVAGGEPVGLCGRDVEGGVLHAQRIEDALLQELLERLAADLLDR